MKARCNRSVKRLLRLPLLALVLLLAVAAPAAAAHAKPKPKAKPGPAVVAHPNAGIVDVYTTLGYQDGQAAGTGMIVTASGEVLTNNHVITGATDFRVVEVSTNRTYTATVVGYSVSEDVAVLQLGSTTGVRPAQLGNSSNLVVGQKVVARGNAGGRGGVTVAAGRVTGLHRQIVAADESTGDTETLTNLVETSAPIEPGDSGGPLLNARGRVVGMVTAGSSSFSFRGRATRGYAIPINRALSVVRQIETGVTTALVHVGATAFLGVQVRDVQGGIQVVATVPGGASETAGIPAGAVITSVDGTQVVTSRDLRTAVLALTPGTPAEIGWTDADGVARTTQVTPAEGPPQ